MSTITLVCFIKVFDKAGAPQDYFQNGKRDNFNALDDGSTQTWVGPSSPDFVFSDSHPEGYWEQKTPYDQQTENIIQLNNEKYYYLPFLYQGAAKNRSGDNLEAALVLANNRLAMNRAIEAVRNRWTVEVAVCKVDPTNFAIQRKLTTETWLAASMSYDPTTIEVLLSSGIDAVGSNAPGRVLTSQLCGHLPTTGQIRNA
tara:strand:+ start:99 stop:698 length:600 start_codon:yes stop_codon:yes gene_type:complete